MHYDRISRAWSELTLLVAMTLFMSLVGCRDFGSGPEKLPTRGRGLKAEQRLTFMMSGGRPAKRQAKKYSIVP